MSLLRAEKIQLASQVFVSHTYPEAEKLQPVQSEHFWKPRAGGLWTSTLNDEGGEWVRWLIGEGYSLEEEGWGGKLWRLEPAEANLLVIWSPAELRNLVEVYPHPELEEFNARYQAAGLEGYLWVNWEEMAKDYDGFHIPNPWPWRFCDDIPASMFFYSMDAECTCWFKWCFEGDPVELDPEPFLAKLKEE
ncbi:MAG TPA: hypothetical protein VLA89_06095 [Gemmatimonadales bacterium]|nr:hypothetical protein [Gemmatimonadales bacterium]